MKTVIEVWHESEHLRQNFVAVKSVAVWKDGSQVPSGWQIDGSSLTVYDADDIAGLRKLLDAVEKELTE